MTDGRVRLRRRVLVNTAATGAGNAWAMVVAVVCLPLMLRGLGPSSFGLWALLQTFSAMTGWLSLADIGLGIATKRAVAERSALNDTQGVARVVSSALVIYLALGASCALLLGLGGPAVLPTLFKAPDALQDQLRTAIILFAFQSLLDLITAAGMACLEGLQRIDLSRAIDAMRRTLVAAATTTAAMLGATLQGVALASLVASAIGTMIAAAVLRSHLSVSLQRPARHESRALISYGSSVGLLNATGVLHRTMDRFIVGAVMGPAAVTLVEIATQVQNAAAAFLAASSYAAIPSAAWTKARGASDALRELLERGTKYSLLVTMPIVTGAMVLADPLVSVWVGSRYAAAAGLIVVALVSIGIAAPLQVGSNVLQGTGRAGLVLRPALAGVVVNLTSSLVLVRLVGVVGVFQGTLLGAAVLSFPLAWSVLREVGVSASEFVGRSLLPVVPPSLALAAASGTVVMLPLGALTTLLVGTGAGAVAYTFVATRWAIRRDELRELRDVILART